MKICFAGDVFLGGDLLNKSAADVIKSSSFHGAELRIVNLEHPISDDGYAEDKCTLLSGSFATTQLREIGIGAVNLAHNHIQDAGLGGIAETINHLESAGISNFGAGRDILQAGKAYSINDNIVLLGYCEYGKSYLKQIKVAEADSPGVNPLRYDKIIQDLNGLPVGKKAILYFHWGREHVWFPPASDLALARKLLDDERVILIVGMHPHRAQGYIEHNGKRAYMCLGNFLFPNFFIAPPTQIFYPAVAPERFSVTRQYHSVHEITYKKWRWINRVSIIVNFDSDSHAVSHDFVVQEDNRPVVDDLRGAPKHFMSAFIEFLSMIYRLHSSIYSPLEKTSTFLVRNIWRAQIYLFHVRQLGIGPSLKKAMTKVRSR